MCKQFRAVNSRKAAGPDAVSSRVIKEYAKQLSSVFCSLFNKSLHDHIPSIWKEACIISIPKSPSASVMNDFHDDGTYQCSNEVP